jgi:hypothetical protein
VGLFSRMIARHEAERHARIVAETPCHDPPSAPGIDGFLPLRDAAAVMELDEAETLSLAQRGLLEWRDMGTDRVWVRPAILATRFGGGS